MKSQFSNISNFMAVQTSQIDYVKVDFSKYCGGDKENIVFKDRYGIKLKLNNDNTLTFIATNKPDLETFTHGGSNWHSVYNSDQKLVLETYDENIKDDNFYLFFVDNVLDKKDSLGTSVSGYMQRGYNCGFIYEGGSLHTVAHELGHGVGKLEHAFSASNSSGKTQNLMDYSEGLDLWHFQWNEVQNPSRVWMKWSKEESEGESWFGNEAICAWKFLNEFCYAYLNQKQLDYKELGSNDFSFTWSFYNVDIKVEVLKNITKIIPNDNKLSSYEKYFKILVLDEEQINKVESDKISSQKVFEQIINEYEIREKRYLEKLKIYSDIDKLLEILTMLPKEAYFKIDIGLRIKLLQKLSEKTFLTEAYFGCVDDKKTLINLIKTIPNDKTQLDKLFSFMDEENMYKKLGSSIDNFGGNSNLYKLNSILCDKWITCYGIETIGEYRKRTSQYFHFVNTILNKPMIHLELSIDATEAKSLFGMSVAATLGLGFDLKANIAVMGSSNFFAYLLNQGFQYNQFSDLSEISNLEEAIDNYNHYNFILLSTGINLSFIINYNLFASDLRTLFGLGTKYGGDFTYKGLSFGVSLNFDSDNNFIGWGIGANIGKDLFDINLSKITSTTRGLIINITEIPDLLTNSTIDVTDLHILKEYYDIEDGYLIINCFLGKITTKIKANLGNPNHDYIITEFADKFYSY
ncbi:MAG: hypothetical protein MJ211_15975 [Bacteroidales bacterium]|nr:hypothetical protein [Bacteroidales bacterium]